ncbi:MAG: NUDIX hydrolase N-terminal domain-containing protein [Ilumatobacteraceae bacterium]
MSDVGPGDFTRELVRWSETLAAIARTGLGFTQSLYEQERFQEVLHVAADIKAAADDALEVRREQDHFVQEWLESVGEGVPGYVTPKVAVGAVVGNERGEVLLAAARQRHLAVPDRVGRRRVLTAEVAVKEVHEETGIECELVQLLSVVDGQRMGFTRFGMYLLLFHCRATGGDLAGHPLETSGVGWFSRDALPVPTAGASWWGPSAFAAIDGLQMQAAFEPVREPIWRGDAG